MAKVKVGGAEGKKATRSGLAQGADNRTRTTEERAANTVVEQTTIEVSDRVGLPPLIRFVGNSARHARERGETTMVVGVDDVERIFAWMGYPL